MGAMIAAGAIAKLTGPIWGTYLKVYTMNIYHTLFI